MHTHRTVFTFVCLALVSSGSIASEKIANSDSITAARLRAHLTFIASDDLEGRATPSRGLDIAAKYLAAQLDLYGLKPAGDGGTYFQKVPIARPSVDAAATSLTLGGAAMKYGEQFYAGTQSGQAEGEIVYMGFGWHRPGDAADPYAKTDLKGKVLLVLSGRPDDVSFADMRAGKVVSANGAGAKFGAVGVIEISNEAADRFSQRAKRTLEPSGGYPQIPSESVEKEVPTVTVRAEALRAMLSDEPASADDLIKRFESKVGGAPFALKSGKRAKFAIKASDNVVYAVNVIASIEGSDPKLKDEYVAIGAHYDHIGMRSSGTGDLINNGADDDGSGTVSVLEIARAFMTGPKSKRSLLFVWHCGEERGLWGSRYFVAKPTVPISSIVAQLNIDMIGRSKATGDTKPQNKMLSGPNAIYLVGTTRMSTDLGKWAKDANRKLYGLTYDFAYDDLKHPEQIFFRSDHFSYAEKGVPILFWFDGVHEDYHSVRDEVHKIDFVKMEKVARTVYATAWDVGNQPLRPKVDMPLQLGN